ncbi:MAG: peptidylprolyl isomerase [Mariprofundales bacterium]
MLPGVVTATAAERLDSIAATVGNRAITCYEVNQAVDTMVQQMQLSRANVPPKNAVFKRILKSKIDEAVELQQAQRLKLTVSDDALIQAMANVEQRNNIPSGQLETVLKRQGVNIEDYRQQMKHRLLISQLVNVDVRGKIQISEESMREYYRKYLADPKPTRELHLSRILSTLPAEPTPRQVEKATAQLLKIRQRIAGGETLASLAPLLSDGSNAAQGGDLGWHYPEAMPAQFHDFLTQSVGALSQPIRMADGMNLMQIDEERWHQPKVGKPYDEMHARHILFRTPSDADAPTRAKILHRAQVVAEEMQKADDAAFATRAGELSQGPSSKRGGDLGWFKRGDMAPAFEKAAMQLQAGQTSGVVTSTFGLHVIRMVERRHVDPNAFEIHQDKISQQLTSMELQARLPRWLAGLKQDLLIDIQSCQ